MTATKGTAAWMSRKKLILCCVIVILVMLFFVIREKYFYRADSLKAVSHAFPPMGMKVQIEKKTETSIWKYFGFSGKSNDIAEKGNVWDRWMEKNQQLTSIGDVYDKCDNKTRTKIGKVVLEPIKDKGVQLTTYVNQTYTYKITASTSHLKVTYKGSLLYDNHYDMCKQALKLDTPYHCPVEKGQTIVIRDVAKLPSYIPKGTYTIFGTTKDQNGQEIACTYAEFKTGEEDEED